MSNRRNRISGDNIPGLDELLGSPGLPVQIKPGNAENVRMAIIFQQLFQSVADFDSVPEKIRACVGDINPETEISDAADKMFDLMQDETDPRQKMRLGYAYNFLAIKYYIESGDQESATDGIGKLVSRDYMFGFLDKCLKEAGTSYLEECLREGKLLTPRMLDQAMFDRFAPQSRELAGVYDKKQGVAFLHLETDMPESYSGAISYDKSVGRKVVREAGEASKAAETTELRLSYRFGFAQFSVNGDFSQCCDVLRDFTGSQGINDYHIARCDDKRIINYASEMFGMRKVGEHTVDILNFHVFNKIKVIDLE